MAQTKQKAIAGKTITFEDFFSPNANAVQKLVDYYEGDQLAYVIQMLDGGMNGWGKRKEWKHRGIIPRVRNITRSIISKSGMLFNRPPVMGIVTDTDKLPVTDPVLSEMLENADWMEVMQNLDIYTRLTGSIILLQQLSIPDGVTTTNGQYRYDHTRGDQLIMTILHHGNTVARMNQARTKITELGFILGDTALQGGNNYSPRPKEWSYCVWTPEEIIEIQVNEDADDSNKTNNDNQIETVISREPNPYGMIPASFFYDTNKPRRGIWQRPAEDLIALQEVVNLALTDTEFAIAFQKQKTLFITGDIINDDANSGDQLIPAAQMGSSPAGAVYNDIPFYQTRKQSYIGGLGSIAKLGSDGDGVAGKAEFIGPDTKLGELDAIITEYIGSVANDWAVNINYGGSGKATSGFQLIVEEISNLQLRELRGQLMQANLRRFYEITKSIYPGQLTDGYLQAQFAAPNLPVNQIEVENIWTLKIDNNRASIKDYFMEEKGLSETEAMEKIADIMAMNKETNIPLPAAPAIPTPIKPVATTKASAGAILAG